MNFQLEFEAARVSQLGHLLGCRKSAEEAANRERVKKTEFNMKWVELLCEYLIENHQVHTHFILQTLFHSPTSEYHVDNQLRTWIYFGTPSHQNSPYASQT